MASYHNSTAESDPLKHRRPPIRLTRYIYIYVCVYVYICIHTYIYIYIYIYMCVYIYIYMCVCVRIYMCVYIHMYICIYLSIHLSTYPSMYLSIHIYINTGPHYPRELQPTTLRLGSTSVARVQRQKNFKVLCSY